MALVIPRRRRTETVGRFGFFEVDRHRMDAEGHETHTIRTRDWVTVAAITEAGEWVLVRQHRHGVDAITIETAGGILEHGEDPAAAALRELREETGYAADRVESLGAVHPNPAVQDNRCHLFLARGVRLAGETDCDEHESTEAVLMTRDEVKTALAEQKITHALTVLALERALAVTG
jgi:ADP-ribose diphosphatase